MAVKKQQKQLFDPETGQGSILVGADLPNPQLIDPRADPFGYEGAVRAAAYDRSVGTPNFLGGPGGIFSMNNQAFGEAIRSLQNTTGQPYKINPIHAIEGLKKSAPAPWSQGSGQSPLAWSLGRITPKTEQ